MHVFPEKIKVDVEWCTHISVVVFQWWNKCMFSSSDLTKTFTVKQGLYCKCTSGKRQGLLAQVMFLLSKIE
jgi:hypothetical protein